MYAFAYYRSADQSRVPFVGSTCTIVIRDLKTLNGIQKRALRFANQAGRGDLFGFEVWSHHDKIYGTPMASYTVEKLDGLDGLAVRVRQYLPLENLARKSNA